MRPEDIQSIIDLIQRLKAEDRGESDPPETDSVLAGMERNLEDLKSAMETAIQRLESEDGRLVDDEEPLTEDQLGLDQQGAVKHRQMLVDNIKALADRIKEAQVDHRNKKFSISQLLRELWPDLSLKSSTSMQELLRLLEMTRRYLITLKLHLGHLNLDSTDGQFKLAVAEKESDFKKDYLEVMEGMIAEEYPIKLHHPTMFKRWRAPSWEYAKRYYYNTLLVQDRELTVDKSRKVNRLNEATPDTMDYVFGGSGPDPIVVFYTGDDKERSAQMGARSRAKGRRLPMDLQRVGADYAKARFESKNLSGKKKPADLDDLKLTKKHKNCKALLPKVLEKAGVNGGNFSSISDYAKAQRQLYELIRACRIHITEMLFTYQRRHNQARFRAVIPTLGKSLEYISERLSDWEAHLNRVRECRQTLTDLESESDEAVFKGDVIDTVHRMLKRKIAGVHMDVLTASLSEAHKRQIARDLGDPESLVQELTETVGDCTALAMFTLWVFQTITLPEDYTEIGVTPAMLVKDFLLPDLREHCLNNLGKENVERLRKFALVVIDQEISELTRLIEWTRGDMAEREKTDWVALGKEIEEHIRATRGVIAFADSFEGSYATLKKFLTYVLYGWDPDKSYAEDEQTPWHKCLYVGSGAMAFQVGVTIEASVASLLKGSANVALQVSGGISQDDDRRVRWKDCQISLVYKAELSTGMSTPDILENQAALEALNLKMSAGVGGSLGGVAHVRVYESHLHMAASIGQSLARAQLVLQYPFNRLAHPLDWTKRYNIWGGVPETATEKKILENFTGPQEPLKKELDLLQRARIRLWSYSRPNIKGSFDASVGTQRGHEETKGHTATYSRFTKTVYDQTELVFLYNNWCARASSDLTKIWVHNHGWSKSWPASQFANFDLSGVWKREKEPGPENPLEFLPVESTPTENIFSSSFNAGRGTIDVSFTWINGHPNPDNDGAYMNIKAVRKWGGSVGSDLTGPASTGLSFNKTRAKKFSPTHLRMQFNRMFDLAQQYFKPLQGKVQLRTDDRPTGEEVDRWLAFFQSAEGRGVARIISNLSCYGIFDLNFIYNDNSGFEIQYGRIWRSYDMNLSVEMSMPALPFLKFGGELSGVMQHCPYETLGLDTVSYILTVYNGFKKRAVVELDWWPEWRDYHTDELNSLFNYLHTRCNARAEIAPDVVGPEPHDDVPKDAEGLDAAASALKTAAEALVELVDKDRVTAHVKATEIEEKIAQTGTATDIQIGYVTRNLLRQQRTRTRLVRLSDFGTAFIWLHDCIGYADSFMYNLDNYEDTKAKPVHPVDRPMFFLRPGGPYIIKWGFTDPHLFEAANIEVLDKDGSSVWSQEITKDDCGILAYKGTDLKSKSESDHEKVEQKYGHSRSLFLSKYADRLYTGTDAREKWERENKVFFLESIIWEGKSNCEFTTGTFANGTALAANKSPYCLRLTGKPVSSVRVIGAAEPLAWTYFHVFDEEAENPLAKLEDYLDAKGNFQPFEQKNLWKLKETGIGELDVDSTRDEEGIDGDVVMEVTSDAYRQQHPVVGVNIEGLSEELPEDDDDPDPDELPPPPDPPRWDGYLGPLLNDHGLIREGVENKIGATPVYLVKTLRQAQHWTCPFHSARNALWLLHLQQGCKGQQDAMLRGRLTDQLDENLRVGANFEKLFFGEGGSVQSPKATTWLKVISDDVPRVRNNGLTPAEQKILLTKIKDGNTVKPDPVDEALAEDIVPVGQLGPREHSFYINEGIGDFLKALKAFRDTDEIKAFTMGVENRHFIACILHRPGDHIEVLVADSLNGDFAENRLAVEGLLAWANDPEGSARASFRMIHLEPLNAIVGRPWSEDEIQEAVAFLETCELAEDETFLDFRRKADRRLAVLEEAEAQEAGKERVRTLRGRLKLD